MSTELVDPAWRKIIEMSRSNNDSAYGEFVADWPMQYYRDRLKQIDFVGFEHVLDVGCGHGHWLSALATLNNRAIGIDIHQKRIETTKALLKDLWLDNADAQVGSALEIPFPDASFDALFCYGVFMFLDRDKALAEFNRVLKPGGTIYACTNARGWWLKLGIQHFFSNRNLSKLSLKSFFQGRRNGIPTAVDLPDVKALLERNGFVEPRAAAEGTLTASGEPTTMKPHYDATYLGFDNVIEFMARKPSGPSAMQKGPRQPIDLALRHVEQALASSHYSFLADLARYPSEDTDELVTATNPAAASLTVTCAKGVDREAFLKRVVEMTCDSLPKSEDRIKACVTLTQKLFYHHFAVQPVDGDRHLVDPVEVAGFRACRCGTSARFLVDLLEVGGFEARLIGAACHTATEVFFDGAWRLVDASLYPPGIVALGRDGGLLKTDEAIANPELLDAIPSYINYNSQHISLFIDAYPRAAKRVEHYLRCPIFPSVGYFGGDLAGPARAGRVERYRKCGFGPGWKSWDLLEPVDGARAPSLPTLQRPQQVAGVRREGFKVIWEPAKVYGEQNVIYDVWLDRISRGWAYDSLPVGHEFALRGRVSQAQANSLFLAEDMRDGPLFVSIVARLEGKKDAFYLPSDEFCLL